MIKNILLKIASKINNHYNIVQSINPYTIIKYNGHYFNIVKCEYIKEIGCIGELNITAYDTTIY